MIPKALTKNNYQLRNDDFFKDYSKWPILTKVQRGDPLQNSQNGRFFWLNVGSFKKQEILVRFWPNLYVWTRNLFQFLMIPKALRKNNYQLRNDDFFKDYSKWPILTRVQRGDPLQNSQNGRFFWLNFGSFKKQEILVRFWPNWYVWTRNLFQSLMIPKALRKNNYQLRNDDFFKDYSKWPILTKVQRGDPLQNSQNGRFFWLNFGSLKKKEILVRFWPNWYVWTRNLFQFLMIPKALRKNNYQLRNDDFFTDYSKWPILTKVQRGDPLQNSQNGRFFWLNFGSFKKKEILVRFWPNWYVWTRNLFQFLMIQKALRKNNYQLRNDDFFKGYSKWPILTNVLRGDPLQNSQNGRFFWLNFGSFKKQEILVRFWPNWYVWTRNLFQFLMIPKALRKNNYQLRNDDFFKGHSKWPILTKVQRGDPLQNSQNGRFFWLNVGSFKKQEILVRFWPNWYVWTRNLFQFLMILKALRKNNYQLRNDDFFKGYSKWPILTKVQRGDPLQNSQNGRFFWLNVGSFKKQEILVRFWPNWYVWTRNLFQFLMILKALRKNNYQLRNDDFFKGYSKWPILTKVQRGDPLQNSQNGRFFWLNVGSFKKQEILVRFWPNWYVWTRNLFQFLMIPKALTKNNYQLRNDDFFKDYSKWPILTKVQRGDPLQNSQNGRFFWLNFGSFKKQEILVRFA